MSSGVVSINSHRLTLGRYTRYTQASSRTINMINSVNSDVDGATVLSVLSTDFRVKDDSSRILSTSRRATTASAQVSYPPHTPAHGLPRLFENEGLRVNSTLTSAIAGGPDLRPRLEGWVLRAAD